MYVEFRVQFNRPNSHDVLSHSPNCGASWKLMSSPDAINFSCTPHARETLNSDYQVRVDRGKKVHKCEQCRTRHCDEYGILRRCINRNRPQDLRSTYTRKGNEHTGNKTDWQEAHSRISKSLNMPGKQFVHAVAPEGDDVPSGRIRTLMDRTRNEGGLASMCRQYFQTFQLCPPHHSSIGVPCTRARTGYHVCSQGKT